MLREVLWRAAPRGLLLWKHVDVGAVCGERDVLPFVLCLTAMEGAGHVQSKQLPFWFAEEK